jgi:sigma-B regulation protein RsbQ
MTFTSPRTGTDDILHRNNVTVSGNPTGRPIVFVHGFGCSQAMWRSVAPRFEQDHRVVLIDLVGAGGSDRSAYDPVKYDSLHGYADDVLEVLEALDLHDAVYVGHSVAATIGILAETTDASRFGALVLVGPSPRYLDDGDYRGGFERADIDGLLDALDANYLGWSETMAPAIMGNAERPELGRQLTESFCAVDPEIARHFARVTFLSDNRRDLAAVRTRTLVLQCSDDVIAPTAVGRYVHRQIPASRFVQLTATGHCPNLSAPDELVDEISGFLR